jgi:glycine dehydrogenase subunit 2
MKLLFEQGAPARRCNTLPPLDIPEATLQENLLRENLLLPELSELDISRHYNALEHEAFGVGNGFYPLGSCTMKYNPKLNERVASFRGFTDIHPLAPAKSVKGCQEVMDTITSMLCDLTGMDDMTMQPAAGAHGELTGVLLIKKYFESRNELSRRKILVPDSAHGTNPATASMAGMSVVNIPSDARGGVDLDALRAACDLNTACIMLTNPNTLGLFDEQIQEICQIVHNAGALAYYDGANFNACMGLIRPGDMGFDCIHLNLHKSFSTPHGGGGPGAGAVGCKSSLSPFLPGREEGIGRIKAFYGNFLVIVRALTYLLTLGSDGLTRVALYAVLNANYLKALVSKSYTVAYDRDCAHEFVLTMEKESHLYGMSALDIAKGLIDEGMHPPTMYFPMIVHEALMVEPTETESKETLDMAAKSFLDVYDLGKRLPVSMEDWPISTNIGRPDEVEAARNPVLTWH